MTQFTQAQSMLAAPSCAKCDDTGYSDHAGFAMDLCDHAPPVATWASPTLEHAYGAVEKLRADLNQHPESGIDESLRRAMDAIELADTELTGLAA